MILTLLLRKYVIGKPVPKLKTYFEQLIFGYVAKLDKIVESVSYAFTQ